MADKLEERREDGLTDTQHNESLRVLRQLAMPKKFCCPKCGGSPFDECELCNSTAEVSRDLAEDYHRGEWRQP